MSAIYQVTDGVAVITMNNPPVNGLSYANRVGIADGLNQALADNAVQAVVLTGAGRAFSAGADISELDSPKALAEPNLLSLILACENASKPVVAALHSVAMGGGLEFDACEMSAAEHITKLSAGNSPFVAVPVFISMLLLPIFSIHYPHIIF